MEINEHGKTSTTYPIYSYCGYCVASLWIVHTFIARKMKRNGESILRDGIMPAGGSLGGNPSEDIHNVPRLMGYGQLYASFIGFMFSYLALIAIPILTIGFPLSVFLASR